ncbi:hypothetical protein [Amycolatopsis minnesotensis]|uniref:hypothetical protein n=1 Tax=Amycolatopsis minnesotensis TaxID=337894 RepID=UPI0031DF2557
MPKYDFDALNYVAGKVDQLHEEFKKSKDKVAPEEGEHPFGTLRHPDDHDPAKPPVKPSPSDETANAYHSFSKGSQGEFEAGAKHMAATSQFLRDAARMMQEQDNASGDAIKKTAKG